MATETITAVITAKDSASAVLKKLDRTIDNLALSISDLNKENKHASTGFGKVERSVISLNQGLDLILKATRALITTFRLVVDEGANFEAQMAAVASISKVTNEEFQALTDEARRIGKTTVFTAVEAGRAMEEFRRQGFDAAETIAITADTMNLAAANAQDLADSAQLTGVAFKLFRKQGLSSTDIIDIFNKTVGASAQNINDFGEAFKFIAGTAAGIDLPLQDVAKIIGVLADQGFRGTLAGTAFRGAIVKLLKPSDDAKKVFAELGLTLEEVNPETNNFIDVLKKLQEAGITSAQTFRIFQQIAGGKFFNVIRNINEVTTDFERKFKNANTAVEAAQVRLDNFKGDARLLGSALSDLAITVFGTFNEDLRKVTQRMIEMTKSFTDFLIANPQILKSIFTGITIAVNILLDAFIGLIRLTGYVVLSFGEIIKFAEKIVLRFDTIVEEGFGNLADAIIAIPKLIKTAVLAIGRVFSLVLDIILDIPKVITKEFPKALDLAGQAVRDLIFIIPGAKRALEFLDKAFTESSDAADELSIALTGNSVVPDLIDTSKESKTASQKLFELADSLDNARKKTADFNGEVITTLEQLEKLADKGAQVEIAKPSFLDPLKTKEGKEFTKEIGLDFARSIVGVSGAMQGAQAAGPIGAIVGFISEILLETESMREVFDIINKSLIRLAEPVGRVLIPIAKLIAGTIDKIAPLFEEIAKFFIDFLNRITPVLEEAFNRLMPLIIASLPIMLEHFVVMIALIEPILELLQELEPVFQLLADFIRIVTPIIKALMPFFKATIISALLPLLIPILTIMAVIEAIKITIDFVRGLFQFLVDSVKKIVDFVRDILGAIGNITGGIAGGIAGGIGGVFGFQSGSEGLTRDQLLRLPGMEAGSGLIKAHVGETVGQRQESGNTFNFYVQAIDPRGQIEEIRQIMEELALTRKLNVVSP